jgi:sugar lactone lactonase YvrE
MAPAHGMVVAQTVGSAQDTRLAVYTGSSLNALTLVGENDDALAGGTSRVQFTATAGTTYHFAVDVNETFATNFGGVRVGVDYAYVSSTFAGSAGNAGTVNGTGAAARFTNPSGIARDSFGNLYVSEAEQHVIRKVTPEGVVSVFAGAPGQFGAVNGNGAAARFNLPYGLAVDANDNVFVADYGNRVIRRITPTGDVTTFAGAFGQGGATDGVAGTARFNLVFGLAIDSAGVLYATDLGNHNVRKIATNGTVSTLAGSAGNSGALDGTTTAARFNQPRGLVVDSQGSVYVADFGNHTVRKITAAGVVTTLAGFAGSIGAADGVGSNARFAGPFAVAIDAQERLYVTDANHRVRVVSPVDGLVTTAAGSTEGAAEGIALAAQFDVPFAIIVAPNGVLYIADYDNHTVRALTPSSQVAVAQSIGFPPLLDRAYTPNPITLNATTTSGLPVIFELVEGDASLDGNQLTLLGTGVVTIRATQPGDATHLPAEPVVRSFIVTPNFLSWQLERFTPEELANATLTGPNADYDRDGVSNLVEYALGRDPKVAGSAPFAEVAASAGEWTFVYSRPADRTDVSYTVEISTNLTTWTTANVTHERIGNGPTETWRARAPLSTGANLFFRLRVER